MPGLIVALSVRQQAVCLADSLHGMSASYLAVADTRYLHVSLPSRLVEAEAPRAIVLPNSLGTDATAFEIRAGDISWETFIEHGATIAVLLSLTPVA